MEGGNEATNGSAVTLSPTGERRSEELTQSVGEPGTLVPGLTELIGYRYYTHGLTPVARLLVIAQHFWLQSLLLIAFANYTEAYVITTILMRIIQAPITTPTCRSTTLYAIARPTATTNDSPLSFFRSRWISNTLAGKLFIPVLTPFPYVAVHIENTPSVGVLRCNRMRMRRHAAI